MRERGAHTAFPFSFVSVSRDRKDYGETLNETVMDSQTAADGNLNNVATGTIVKTCCRGADTITIENIGTTTVTVVNPNLRVGRWS